MDDDNDLTDFNVDEVASDIGESLFPRSEPTPGEVVAEAVEVKPEPQTPTPAAPAPEGQIVPGQNSVAKPLPKAWKKDMAPHWEKLPPEVHEYVHAREADVMRGFQQYQAGYQAWDTLVKPFAPVFQQHPDVNPVQLMQGLMNTHLQLLQSSPEEKTALARKILSDYSIDLSGQPAEPADQRLMAELHSLRSELGQIKQTFSARQRAEYESGVNAQLKEIEAFAAKPENEFFNEVGNDILRFLQNGSATDLASAYELACWANPGVRAKMLAKQQAPAPAPAPTPQRKANGQFVNLDSPDPTAARTRKSPSIDATIDNIVSSHFPKH
jgi:hypothetical protein